LVASAALEREQAGRREHADWRVRFGATGQLRPARRFGALGF